MKGSLIQGMIVSAMALLVSSSASPQNPSIPQPDETSGNAHVVNTFSFGIAAAMAKVAPLFGPEAERSWAGTDWNPVFVYPQPGRDVQGAVFTVKRGPINSIWVNTIFDVPAGKMRYVALFGEKFVVTIDVQVTTVAAERTRVAVTYSRTALSPVGNEEVKTLGASDAVSGPHWQHGIEAALGLRKNEVL